MEAGDALDGGSGGSPELGTARRETGKRGVPRPGGGGGGGVSLRALMAGQEVKATFESSPGFPFENGSKSGRRGDPLRHRHPRARSSCRVCVSNTRHRTSHRAGSGLPICEMGV